MDNPVDEPQKAKHGRGRRSLRISPGRGRAIYEAMVGQRKESGEVWGVSDLAERVGVSRNTPARWFAGGAVDRKTLLAIAQATGVKPISLENGDVLSVRLQLLRLGLGRDTDASGLVDPWGLEGDLDLLSADTEKVIGSARKTLSHESLEE